MVGIFFKNSQKLLERQQNSILSAASVITVATFLASILGLVKTNLLNAYYYRPLAGLPQGAALDAYKVSFLIPDTVFQLMVVGALSAAFIPIFTKYRHKKSQAEAVKLANSMMNLILIGFTLFSLLIFVFARQLNAFFTGPEFTSVQLDLATQFTRIMLIAQFFFAISSFVTGFIQANQRFIIPALAPLFYNLGIIVAVIVLSPWIGLYAAAVGVVFGAFLHLCIQLPLALRLGYRYQALVQWNHPGVKEMSRLMLPRTLALSATELENYVTVFLATTIPYGGTVWIMGLAQQLMKAPIRVFGVPIGQASLPFLSHESAANQLAQFKQTLLNSFLQIVYLSLPASILLLVLRIPLVRIIYGTKNFPWEATLLTGKIVGLLAIAVTAHALTQLLSRAFYALHNTTWPLAAAIMGVISNIFVASYCIFVLDLGLVSLAFGILVGAWTNFLVLFFALISRIGEFLWTELVLSLTKIIIASSLMGVFLWIPMRLFDQILDTTRTINLIMLTIATVGIGGMVYLWLANLFEVRQQDAVIRLFDKLGNWQKVLSSSEETIESSAE